MKKIEELTEREIIDLKDDEINKMVRLLCAENGIKIISAPEEPEYEKIPEEDLVAYRIDRFNYIFLDKEEAEQVCVLLSKLQSFKDYSYFCNCKFLVEQDATPFFSVQKIKVYSSHTQKVVLPLIERNDKIQEDYNKEIEEYNSEKKKMDMISSQIWNRVNNVRDEYANMERLWNIYKDEYLSLTEDESMAMEFLKKAYMVNPKTKNFIEDKLKH
jgi:hypothetical protein